MRKITLVISVIMQLRLKLSLPYFSRLLGLYGPRREKPCLQGIATNTGADQPAHPRSLISAFVISYLESIICELATGEISTF